MEIGNPCVFINPASDEVVEQETRVLQRVRYVVFSNFDLNYDLRDGTLATAPIPVGVGAVECFTGRRGVGVRRSALGVWRSGVGVRRSG